MHPNRAGLIGFEPVVLLAFRTEYALFSPASAYWSVTCLTWSDVDERAFELVYSITAVTTMASTSITPSATGSAKP